MDANGDANVEKGELHISESSFHRDIRHGIPSFAVFTHDQVSPQLGQTASPVDAQIEEFGDVFPDELPNGLPPERSHDFKIILQQLAISQKK
jgi:hypothetical protein